MRSRIAIVAAMAREIAPLVRGWKLERQARGVTVYSSARAVAVYAGMGKRRAEIAAETAIHYGPIHEMLSVGLAGGGRTGIAGGSLHFVSRVVDASTGEVFEREERREANFSSGAVLVTADRLASAAEKLRLREQFAAELVDMEASAVAAVARERSIPFLAIKAVSDEAGFDLPAMEKFATSAGGFEEGAFALHVALRPGMWLPTIRLARSSATGIRRLCAEIDRHLAEAAIRGGEQSELHDVGVG